MDKIDIYEAYRRKYGQKAQLQKATEELGELIVELMHFNFDRGDISKLSEEVADVEIMTDQIKYLFGINDAVAGYVDMKLKRMQERLNN